MKQIRYIVEDVRNPVGQGKNLIIHCCNDLGAMGSGVAKALLDKWATVKSEYVKWHKSGRNFELGNIQAVKVGEGLAVINMIGQRDIKPINGIPPVRYGALRRCCKKVADIALKYNATVNVPYKMGSDLAGGEWSEIEKILIEEFSAKDIEVVVYDIFNQRGIGK